MTEDARLAEARALWNEAAATFDAEPDHGLGQPETRDRWAALLMRLLPPPPAQILDAGCGTGSLSVLLAARGYSLTGMDVSPAMIERARVKAAQAGLGIDLRIGDANVPDFPARSFSAVLCRHVLWALPEPQAALARWCRLLGPGGSLVLIEGRWHTGAGMPAHDVVAALPKGMTVAVEYLSHDPLLWGGPVSDERFVVSASLPTSPP